MTKEQQKQLDSLIGSLKGNVIQWLDVNYMEAFFNWCNKLILDTAYDHKEKDLLKKIKSASNQDDIQKMRVEKKKFLPKKYPNNISIGDVVYINFGYGYCNELSDGHYGIILSEIKAGMYFVIPCSSTPLKIKPYPIRLGVPNKENDPNKTSYLCFDQIRMIHYRRIQIVSDGKKHNVGNEVIKDICSNIKEFLDFN